MIQKCLDEAELLTVLRAQNIILPLRSERRTKEHIERRVLFRLVATLMEQGQVTFPIYARKRERPDFELIMADAQIGLEVSEALLSNYAEHQKLQELEFPESFMEPGHFRRGTVPLKKQREILASKQLTARPYMGNAIEREWAEGIARVVESKHQTLTKPGFQRHPSNWLAIMDSLYIHSDWIPDGLTLLRPLIASIWSREPSFHRVLIDHGRTLVSLTANKTEIVAINNLWHVA